MEYDPFHLKRNKKQRYLQLRASKAETGSALVAHVVILATQEAEIRRTMV
jgi:hypothetical protein